MSSRSTSKQLAVESNLVPVQVRDNDAARLYTNVHPALLIAGYLAQFKYIVADPVTALTSGLLPLSALQLSYIITCLPATGKGGGTGTAKHKRKHTGEKGSLELADRIVPALISFIVALAFGTPVIAVLLVLLGAPFSTHQPHTLLCAAHMSLMVATPLVYVYGVRAEVWQDIVALAVPVDEVFGAALGTLFGAWLGAVPIPLDWDRDWQKWPVTIVTGAYFGCVAGKIAGAYLFKGYRVKLK